VFGMMSGSETISIYILSVVTAESYAPSALGGSEGSAKTPFHKSLIAVLTPSSSTTSGINKTRVMQG
jgi:hypothetical protein